MKFLIVKPFSLPFLINFGPKYSPHEPVFKQVRERVLENVIEAAKGTRPSKSIDFSTRQKPLRINFEVELNKMINFTNKLSSPCIKVALYFVEVNPI